MTVPLGVFLAVALPLAAAAGVGVLAAAMLCRRPIVLGQIPACGARPVGINAPTDWRCAKPLGHKYLHETGEGAAWGANTFISELPGEFTRLVDGYVGGKHARQPSGPGERVEYPVRLRDTDPLDDWPEVLGLPGDVDEPAPIGPSFDPDGPGYELPTPELLDPLPPGVEPVPFVASPGPRLPGSGSGWPATVTVPPEGRP